MYTNVLSFICLKAAIFLVLWAPLCRICWLAKLNASRELTTNHLRFAVHISLCCPNKNGLFMEVKCFKKNLTSLLLYFFSIEMYRWFVSIGDNVRWFTEHSIGFMLEESFFIPSKSTWILQIMVFLLRNWDNIGVWYFLQCLYCNAHLFGESTAGIRALL